MGENDPEEADPVRIERELGAGAVVTLIWRDPSHLRARIRLHVAANGHTTTRELVFSEADTRVERGRTLGLAAASMWPEIRAPAAAPRPLPANAPAGHRPSEADARPAAPAQLTSPPVTPRSGRVEPAEIPRFAVGVAAQGAGGLTGDTRGIGARLEGTFRISSGAWSLRAALSARTGPVAVLSNGADLTAALAGGVEWWPEALRAASRARFGARADAMVLRHQVSGAAATGASQNRSRFLPGFDLLAQAMMRITSRIDLVAAAGAELALGSTDIRTGSPPTAVATIPAFQLVAEAGLRVGF
jgi:hypothetical protein